MDIFNIRHIVIKTSAYFFDIAEMPESVTFLTGTAHLVGFRFIECNDFIRLWL